MVFGFKTHFAVEPDGALYKCACGHVCAFNGTQSTNKWADVNCKKCLKKRGEVSHKPRQRADSFQAAKERGFRPDELCPHCGGEPYRHTLKCGGFDSLEEGCYRCKGCGAQGGSSTSSWQEAWQKWVARKPVVSTDAVCGLVTSLWYQECEGLHACGHPGTLGPASDDEDWTPEKGELGGAIESLKQILECRERKSRQDAENRLTDPI